MSEVDGRLAGYSDEGVESGIRAIKTVEGNLESVKMVTGEYGDQAEVLLTDAVVTEMYNDQPIPDLKDDKFTLWIPYSSKPGMPASPKSQFLRGFAKSAEELWKSRGETTKKGWQHLVGSRVSLTHAQEKEMTIKERDTGELKKVKPKVWLFVAEGKGTQQPIEEYAADHIKGKTPKAAIREVAMDSRLKREPSYLAAVKAGQPIVGLEVAEDGTYQPAKS